MKAEFFSFISRFAESSAGWSKHTRPVLDRAFARWIPPRPDEAPNWATDADWARIDQEPLRARYLLRSIGIVLLVFVLWAAFATVDEVTRGSGKVIPTSQVQIVQAVDGGVVAEILVREGQSVEAGQSLFLIDKTRFVSSLRENRVQYLALLAKAARLRALAGASWKPRLVSRASNWRSVIRNWSKCVRARNRLRRVTSSLPGNWQ
jgi:adhesin transport system membrane fusion protein